MVAEYALPELPYDYSALEPYISGQIMELHHSKHHLAYVKGVNTAVEQLAEARSQESFANVNGLEKNLSFHLGGNVNHSVFWPNMSPEGGDKPTGDLAAAIDEWFGSFDAFRTHFQANALAIQGSGWSILAWDVLGQRLHIAQLYDQQSNLPACLVPLLMLDMWEHAYYLQYLNDKASFVKEWWHVANWADVDARFQRARSPDAGADRPVSLSEGRRAEMLRLIEDAQRVAGIVAARDRGDKAGATELISAFDDEGSMAQGSLLLTEMLLQLHHARTGQDVQETLRELTIQLEASVRAA